MFLKSEATSYNEVTQEAPRLPKMDRFELLDTSTEEELEDLTNLASQLCDTPLSVISLLSENRQWFRTKIGLEVMEVPTSITFCQHAIRVKKVFEVMDAANDPEFQHNPMVTNNPNIRFYAGAPLITAQGHTLGTICVIDTQPRILTEDQRTSLEVLARQVVLHFELKRNRLEREKEQVQLAQVQEKLRQLQGQMLQPL